MPLNKPALEAALIEAFSNPSTSNNVVTVSKKLADAIEAYVKSGKVEGECPPEGGPLIEGKVV